METRSAKKRRLQNIEQYDDYHRHGSAAIDHISELPDAVLHHILSLLPIKTIAQTTVLSSRFRSLWSSLPDLDFSNFNLNNVNAIKIYPKPFIAEAGKKLNPDTADFIDQILNLRDKHSNIRILRFQATLSFSRLNALFRLAIKHNVQELDVSVTTNDYFNFPRSVIASDSLRVFKLRSLYPGFRLPPSSVMANGFRSLHSLSLTLMIFYNQPSLLHMFTNSAFPLLRKLSMDSCFGLKHLRIRCQSLEDLNVESCFQLQSLDVEGSKLESLRISGCFDANYEGRVKIAAPNLKSLVWTYNAISGDVFLDNLTSLREASVGLLIDDVNMTKLQSLSTLMLEISQATFLTLENQCIEILSNNSYFAAYLPTFNNLKSLELQTVFKKNSVPGLANIFKSCPILKTLIIKILNDKKVGRRDWHRDLWEVASSEEEQSWESQTEALTKSFLLHLNVVKIHGFMECENEVSLVKFLLKHGKALQEITLFTEQCNHRDTLRRQKIRSQIMGFSRASSMATITFH